MALAEEEDDDEEDDLPSRRGSSSKLPSGMIGAPPKSLKGKETFKPHMTSRAELARAVAERKGKAKGKGREEKREVGEGMVEDSSGDSSSESEEVGEEKPITESMLGHGADGGRERSRQRAPSSSTVCLPLDAEVVLLICPGDGRVNIHFEPPQPPSILCIPSSTPPTYKRDVPLPSTRKHSPSPLRPPLPVIPHGEPAKPLSTDSQFPTSQLQPPQLLHTDSSTSTSLTE